MDPKAPKLELFEQLCRYNWNIDFLGEPFKETQFSEKEIIPIGVGDIFDFKIKRENIIDANLTTKDSKHVFNLPFFLCLSPIWFVDKGALYVTFITGDKLCSLRKAAFRFDGFDTKEPKFFFNISPSNDCDCSDCCKPELNQVVLMYSMGGGSGTTN